MLARAGLTIGARPHVVARLGGDDQFVPMAGKVLHQDAADVFLSRSRRRAVVVREIEMSDATVKRAVHDAPGLFKLIDMAEVVPESK